MEGNMYYILSIIFGLIPEVLYFTLFLIFAKDIKEKKIRLFLLIGISYFICILIQQWQVLYYMLLVVLTYLSLKVLYKKKAQIIDVFIIMISSLWLALLSFILIFFVKSDMSNYMIIYFADKILLFTPFIFRNKFNIIYKKYCKLWNRNDNEKRPIKSITIRNISLILLNSFIFFLNIAINNITNFISKVRC
jgi:hypothetical protein